MLEIPAFLSRKNGSDWSWPDKLSPALAPAPRQKGPALPEGLRWADTVAEEGGFLASDGVVPVRWQNDPDTINHLWAMIQGRKADRARKLEDFKAAMAVKKAELAARKLEWKSKQPAIQPVITTGVKPMLNVNGKSTTELVAIHNRLAAKAGKPPVKRFSDRKAAERRVKEIAKAAGATNPDRIPTDAEFGCREGTNRAALLTALREGKGKPVGMNALLKAVYGNSNKENRGPLMMVMKGLTAAIKANKLPYVIEKSRENKENHFAFKAKN